MKRKTDDELKTLMHESIMTLVALFIKEGPLRVPESDQILTMVFSYFLESSIKSIPEHMRADYLKHRMITLSQSIACGIEDIAGFECEDCKNGTHVKKMHFDA